MDFIRYAEAAAALLNADLSEVDGLVALPRRSPRLQERAADRDCMLLRKLQRELRPVFDAGEAGDVSAVVGGLNELLARHPITPQISDHDASTCTSTSGPARAASPSRSSASPCSGSRRWSATSAPTGSGVCSSATCTNVFVDASPNRSRRYCSDRCSSRANVAAYRARRRAAATA